LAKIVLIDRPGYTLGAIWHAHHLGGSFSAILMGQGAGGRLIYEAIAIAEAIIKRRTGSFDPSTYKDRYQEAFRALIEAGGDRQAALLRLGAPAIGADLPARTRAQNEQSSRELTSGGATARAQAAKV
jgi:hypothetical protein